MTAFFVLLLTLAGVGSIQISTFEEFKVAFENETITTIQITVPEVDFPCPTSLVRIGPLGVSAPIQTDFTPSTKTACPFSIRVQGGDVNFTHIRIQGDVNFNVAHGRAVRLTNVAFRSISVVDSSFLWIERGRFSKVNLQDVASGSLLHCSFDSSGAVQIQAQALFMARNASLSIFNSHFGPSSIRCLSIGSSSAISIANGTFERCVSQSAGGGAILAFGTAISLNVEGVQFLDSTSDSTAPGDAGGALLIDRTVSSSISVVNSSFSGCSASAGGCIAGAHLVNTSMLFSRVSIDCSIGAVAPFDGGAIFFGIATTSSLQMLDASISNCDASNSGAGVSLFFLENSHVLLARVAFSSLGTLVTPKNGGGVFAQGLRSNSSLKLIGLHMSVCVAEGTGSGVSLADVNGSSIDIRNTSFADFAGNAVDGGGLSIIRMSGSSVSLASVVFNNTNALGSGGAIFMLSLEACRVSIIDTTFLNLQFPTNGGGISIQAFRGSALQLSRSTFSQTVASDVGGGLALLAFANSSAEIRDTVLLLLGAKDFVTASGGGLCAEGFVNSTLRVSHTVFSQCESLNSGSGIYLTAFTHSTVAIVDSHVSHSALTAFGGGLYADDFSESVLKLQRVRFSFLEASIMGAAIAITSVNASTIEMSQLDVSFVARQIPLYWGGAICLAYADNVSLSISNSSFAHIGTKRFAPVHGGAIALVSVTSSSLSLESLLVTDCNAEQSGSGISLEHFYLSSFSLMEGSTLASNGQLRAPSKGTLAFYDLESCSIQLDSVVLQDCEASESSAGIHANALAEVTLRVSNSMFLRLGENSPPLTGGAFALVSANRNSKVRLCNVTIDNCSAASSGGGVFLQYFGGSSVFLSKVHIRTASASGQNPVGFAVHASEFRAGSSLKVVDSFTGCTGSCEAFTNGAIVLQTSSQVKAEFSRCEIVNLLSRSWEGQLSIVGCDFSTVGTVVDIVSASHVLFALLAVRGQKSLSLQSVDDLRISNCSFSYQSSRLGGASLSLSSVRSLMVEGSKFSHSTQTEDCIGCGGSAISLFSVSGLLENVAFENLTALASGGSVFVGPRSNIVFSECSWSSCKAGRNGGAVSILGSSVSFQHNSRFENCESSGGDGGAVSAVESAVGFSGVTVDSTFAADRGGFLSAVSCRSITFRNVSASGCSSLRTGGFLSLQDVEHVSLLSVASFNTTSASAGAIMFDSFKTAASCSGSDVRLTDSVAADTGGCIQMMHSGCHLSNSVLSNCSSGTRGGAVQLLSLSVLSGQNLSIQDSFSERGGAVYASGESKITFRNCSIKNNGVSSTGGALMLYATLLSDFGSTFSGNTAISHGGTILATESTTLLLNETRIVDSESLANGGGVYLSQASGGRISDAQFENCAADGSGGAIFVANDRSVSKVTVTGGRFARNIANISGGALALMDQTSIIYVAGASFFNNSAARGGAVFFETLLMPEGLNQSTHHGNLATKQGAFAASGPVKLRISPSSFSHSSGNEFSVSVLLLDFFNGIVADASDTCVQISSVFGDPVQVLGGSGSFTAGKATLNSLMLVKNPGASGVLVARVSAYNLSLSIPYSLRECRVGEIAKDNRCLQCEYSTYALNKSAPSCSSCPDGAVCVNGRSVVPKWGYWSMPGGNLTQVGVCDETESCFLPKCIVKDACFGVRSLWIDVESFQPNCSICAFTVRSGYSRTVAAASARGNTSVLVAERYWATFVALNCSYGGCRLFLQPESAWPTWGAASVRAQLFVLSQTCHDSYKGNLCSDCASGYGRTSGAECGRCEDPWMAFLLAGAFLLVGVVVVAAMTWSTLRNAEKKESQLVSIAKVAWTFAQMMALCAALPMNWPSEIETLFRVQDAASSVNSRQFVSLDCLLWHLGIDHGNSIVFHAAIVMLAPLLIIAAAGLIWTCISCLGRNRTFSVGPVDKFFVSCLTILFLCYPSLCRNAFELFPCTELSTGQSFMTFSLSTSCSSGSYSLAVAIGVAGVLFYAFGIPAVSFFLVWRKRRLLFTSYARSTVGFLYLGYSSKCYYYESVILLKKMLFGGLVLMSSWLGARVSSSLSIALFAAAYVVHIELKPFEDPAVDRLERLSLIALVVCVLCGQLLYSEDLGSFATALVMVLLTAVTLSFFLCALSLLAVSRRQRGGAAAKKGEFELPRRQETRNPVLLY